MKKKYKLTDETIKYNNRTLHRIVALQNFSDVNAGDKGGFIMKESNLSHKGYCWVYDNSMVLDDAKVKDNAKIEENSIISNKAIVSENARVSYSKIYCYVKIYGYAYVSRYSVITNKAEIYDNAIIYSSSVANKAKIFGHSFLEDAQCYDSCKVYGHASILKHAEISDRAEVFGDAEVFGSATIRGNAKVQSTTDYIVFKNWWSSGRYFTWTRSNDRWSVGCFYGTGKQLIDKAYKDWKEKGVEYERVVNYVDTIKKKMLESKKYDIYNFLETCDCAYYLKHIFDDDFSLIKNPDIPILNAFVAAAYKATISEEKKNIFVVADSFVLDDIRNFVKKYCNAYKTTPTEIRTDFFNLFLVRTDGRHNLDYSVHFIGKQINYTIIQDVEEDDSRELFNFIRPIVCSTVFDKIILFNCNF